MFSASLASGYEMGFWLLFIHDYWDPVFPSPTTAYLLEKVICHTIWAPMLASFLMAMPQFSAQTFLSTILFLLLYFAVILLPWLLTRKSFSMMVFIGWLQMENKSSLIPRTAAAKSWCIYFQVFLLCINITHLYKYVNYILKYNFIHMK